MSLHGEWSVGLTVLNLIIAGKAVHQEHRVKTYLRVEVVVAAMLRHRHSRIGSEITAEAPRGEVASTPRAVGQEPNI